MASRFLKRARAGTALLSMAIVFMGTACGPTWRADARVEPLGSPASRIVRPATIVPPPSTLGPSPSPLPEPRSLPAVGAADPGTTGTVVRSGAEVSAASAVAEPVSIAIPDISLTSSLVPVGTLADGSVAVPPDPAIAGWFSPGPRPGERGPAVIMGHVDSQTGPGVFFHLAELSIGSTVTVTSADGPRNFVVQTVERFPKDTFPTARVYGAVPEPALRLITCGGTFDRSTGHYRDNVVVFLAQVAVR